MAGTKKRHKGNHGSSHSGHCNHCLHACSGCDVAYCCDCSREWGLCHRSHYADWYTTPIITSGTWVGDLTTSNTSTITTAYPVSADCNHTTHA